MRLAADELLRFARKAKAATGLAGTVSILVESNERMQAMNRYFRRKNKPTDVLSFTPAAAVARFHSGDIAISADIAAVNAEVLGHPIADEVKVLILHGMLHLAGFDHETDSGEMARREARLRARMRLPLSLTERSVLVRAKTTPSRGTTRIGSSSKAAGGQRRRRLTRKLD